MRSFRQTPNKPQPEPDCWFFLFTAFSSLALSRLSALRSCERGSDSWQLRSRRWGSLGGARGWGWYEVSAELQTCLPSSKHRRRLSQRAAAAAATASRGFNESDAFLQPTYLPPASPPRHLCRSLPLPAPILAAPRQWGERARGIIYCVPVENERLLHFNEH